MPRSKSTAYFSILIGLIGILTAAFLCTATSPETPQPNRIDIPTATLPAGVYPTAAPATAAAYRPVTWTELAGWLASDHTNWTTYNLGTYNCVNFSVDLAAHARQQGMDAWVVAVDFKDEAVGHAFVAFPTSDRGVVYIEPQDDIPFTPPKIGARLCDSWGEGWCMGVVTAIYEGRDCATVAQCEFVKIEP